MSTTSLPGSAPAPEKRLHGARRYFVGQSASSIGDGTVAVIYAFAALEITSSGYAIPAVLIGLWVTRTLFIGRGGRAADGGNVAAIMLVSDLVRLAAQLFTALCFLIGEAQVWQLVVSAVVYGAATAYFMPSSMAMMPRLLPAERLQSFNSRLGVMRNIGLLVGPAIAAGLYALGGVPLALAFDVLTFAISVVFLASLVSLVAHIRAGEDDDEDDDDEVGLLRAFRVLGAYPVVAWMVAVWSVVLVGVASINVLGPLIARDELGGIETWSVLVTAMAVGGLSGSALADYVRTSRPTLLVLVLLGTAMPAQLLVAGVWPTLVPMAVLFALTSVALAICGVVFDTYLQTAIPVSRLGRVSSAESGITSAMIPLGFVLSLPIAELVGRPAFLIGNAAVIVALFLLALSASRGADRVVADAGGTDVEAVR